MGRKRTHNSIKDRHVSFRLSAEEHFRLMNKAQRSGLSVGDFVRARSLGARGRKRPAANPLPIVPAELDLATQLRKIGVNVNQIAHHCNRYQTPPPADLAPLLTEIRGLLAASYGPAR
jgi:Bacterial mobilisation protein (MobC)